MTELSPLADAALPAGIRSRFVDGVNGLRMHILEAGFEEGGGLACCFSTAFRNWLSRSER
jgi:hypothetical protein